MNRFLVACGQQFVGLLDWMFRTFGIAGVTLIATLVGCCLGWLTGRAVVP